MKKLYEFEWQVGRMGVVESVFIAEESELQNAIGKELYFGEILGKHSEICGVFEESYVVEKSDDQDFIQKLEALFPYGGTISGYNPLKYLSEEG